MALGVDTIFALAVLELKEQGVKTLEKAKEQGQFFVKEKSTEKPKARAYSKEQLDALFDSLEEIEV